MYKLRVIIVLIFALFSIAFVFAAETQGANTSEIQPVNPEKIFIDKPSLNTLPEITNLKTPAPLPLQDIKTTNIEIPPAKEIKLPEIEKKITVKSFSPSEPSITPYKSNPAAVKAVDKNLSLFTDRFRDHFALWLSRSGKYLDMMREILKNKNIPEEIVFLSLIESGFNPYAYSRARAVGPWQFISGTAKKYGLIIDWWRDERRDPIKSTMAAANYLSDLYGMFGSWDLAMAAYNAGEGKIMRALNRTKTDDYWALLKTRYIRKETKNYVPKFIAASMIAVSPETFGFTDIEYHIPFDYDEVTLKSPIDLDVAAQCANTSLETIKELNPELRRWCTPPHTPEYILRVPRNTKELFIENMNRIPESERYTLELYTIKKGDTISKIAKKTGVTAKAILVLNNFKNSSVPLKPGTEILLPPKEKFTADKEDKYEIKKGNRKSKKKTVKTNANDKMASNPLGNKKPLN
ncbi:MAG: transglycosylase SLT domain-containing protein [Nitrospiraceae bacterium]|nr:transglycosylase SLT domain-containing protein [Nitrospiraceae bacterium]